MINRTKQLAAGLAIVLSYVTGLVHSGIAQQASAPDVPAAAQPNLPRMEIGAAFAEPLSDCPGISGLLYSNERGIRILFAELKNTVGGGQKNESATKFIHHIGHGSCRYEITFGRQELRGSTWVDSKLRAATK